MFSVPNARVGCRVVMSARARATVCRYGRSVHEIAEKAMMATDGFDGGTRTCTADSARPRSRLRSSLVVSMRLAVFLLITVHSTAYAAALAGKAGRVKKNKKDLSLDLRGGSRNDPNKRNERQSRLRRQV